MKRENLEKIKLKVTYCISMTTLSSFNFTYCFVLDTGLIITFFPLVNVPIINFDLVMELYSGKYPQNTCLYQMHVRDVLIRQILPNFECRFRKLSS